MKQEVFNSEINNIFNQILEEISARIDQTEHLIKKKKAEDNEDEAFILERVRLIESLSNQKAELSTIKYELNYALGKLNQIEEKVGFEEIERMLLSLHLLEMDKLIIPPEKKHPMYYIRVGSLEPQIKANKDIIDKGYDLYNLFEKEVNDAIQICEIYSGLDIYQKIEEQKRLILQKKMKKNNDEPGGGPNGTPGGDER